MPVRADRDEDRKPQIDLFRINQSHFAGDDTVVLQTLKAAPAGVPREPDLLPQSLDTFRHVGLKDRQDLSINIVNHHRKSSQIGRISHYSNLIGG